MPVIGITGGLATGKSAVMEILRRRGAVVFSADEAARAVLNPRSALLREIAAAFGPEVLTDDGNLNRARLAERIFADETARKRLDHIMHPPILSLLRAQIEAVQDDFAPETVIAVEVPLLFETNLSDWFDRIAVVDASETVQISRLMSRSGLNEAEARRRIAAQMSLSEKKSRADFVISNNGPREALAAQVNALFLSPGTENLPPPNKN